ncbi:MAG: PQQ-dependent sugar dehydrogenase [Fibrobacteres bacterium]|nr:PQQ-dependent sugar dehydrogenase [Fibrobacterota bacterium]
MSTGWLRLAWFLTLTLWALGMARPQAALPTNITFTKIMGTDSAAGRFTRITWMGEMPGQAGTFLVVERGSFASWDVDSAHVWKVAKDNQGHWTRSIFLTLGGIWQETQEAGVLSLAFHPDFASNRLYYLFYTPLISGARYSVIQERKAAADFSQDGGDAPRTLLQVARGSSNNYGQHNGGCLAFGPDGYLYAGFGDNLQQTPAQDSTSFLGKIIRIDVNSSDPGLAYHIPADNPFYAGTKAGLRKEIWALGFRNPWRFSFDGSDLWVGEVGENTYEEIDRVAKGGNYGWPCQEGNSGSASGCPNALPPYYQIVHDGGISMSDIIGGMIFRGNAASPVYGQYIYADHVSGSVFAMTMDGSGPTGTVKLGTAPRRISHLTADSKGRLYAVGYGNSSDDESEIYLLDNPALLPDTVSVPLAFTTSSLPAGRANSDYSATLQASGGTPPYTFTVTAGALPAGLAVSGTRISGKPSAAAASVDLELTVSDAAGHSVAKTLNLAIAANRAPHLSSATSATINAGTELVYTAAASDSDGNTVTYAFRSLPAWMAASGATARGTPHAADGNAAFWVVASDGALADSQQVSIKVNHRPPHLTSPASVMATEGSEFLYVAAAVDSDGNALTFTFRSPPAWITATGASARGTPGASDGNTTFRVVVSDGIQADSLLVSITVNHTNHAPLVDSSFTNNTSLAEGDSASLRIVAHDPDGDSLAYAWILDGGTPAAGTARFNYKPGYLAAGVHHLVARVTDPGGASATQSFDFTVTNVALPPACLHAPGAVATGEPFLWGWEGQRDPDLDTASLRFRVAAYRDSALTQSALARDSLSSDRLNDGDRAALAKGIDLFVRVAAFDLKGHTSGFGPVRKYVFAVPVAVVPDRERARKVRAFGLATRPGRVDKDAEKWAEQWFDARGRPAR